jgi:hypothetical protein
MRGTIGRFILLLIIPVLLGSGCVRYHERLVIPRGDDPGMVVMTFTVEDIWTDEAEAPELFDEAVTRQQLAAVPGVEVIRIGQTRAQKQIHIEIVLGYKDISTLSAVSETLAGMDPGIDFLGHIEIEYRDDDTLRFTRTIDIVDKSATAEDRATVADVRWYYTVKFPGRIIESNAEVVSRDGDAATWGYSLDVLGASPMTMEAVVSTRHVSTWVFILVSGIVFIGVFAVLYKLLSRLDGGKQDESMDNDSEEITV